MKLSRFIAFLFLILGHTLAGIAHSASPDADAAKPVHIGLTPALLHDQYGALAAWKTYLQQQLGRPVVFVQRDSYRETMDMLTQNQLDFAWICDYPYILLKNEVKLLVVPLYQGRPLYRSYLIVPAKDIKTRSIADLKGQVFVYADPHSNTGYLVPRFAIKQLGENPGTFFRKTFFTWSHRKLIEAVAVGLAQGGMVDSYIWDSLAQNNPSLTARTRIADQSKQYGFPPLVAHKTVPPEEFKAMQDVLLGMTSSPEGKTILERFNLDGFTLGDPALYRGVEDMMRDLGEP